MRTADKHRERRRANYHARYDRMTAVTGGAVLGGLAGVVVTSVATPGDENPRPAELLPLDETVARTTLAELQLAQ